LYCHIICRHIAAFLGQAGLCSVLDEAVISPAGVNGCPAPAEGPGLPQKIGEI